MRVLVAGATGLTGQILTRLLIDRGHAPVALVRDHSDTSSLSAGTDTRTGDLTDLPEDVCDGMDAVIFAAGSGSGTGPEATEAVDRGGACALIDRAAATGVGRFVMLSSIGAGDPPQDGPLTRYLEAKQAADDHLQAYGFSYTIVRPVALTDDGVTGRVRTGEAVNPEGEASRGDVAAVLADALLEPGWENATFKMETLSAAA